MERPARKSDQPLSFPLVRNSRGGEIRQATGRPEPAAECRRLGLDDGRSGDGVQEAMEHQVSLPGQSEDIRVEMETQRTLASIRAIKEGATLTERKRCAKIANEVSGWHG